ncbi:MAG TPA: FkbM family methyltransferase [Actinomycetota bacterium]|nr:FkbM family methyltransferase [Actinomycetota bacterium]
MTGFTYLKRPLRALRAWPPLNLPLTTAVRKAVQISGLQVGALAQLLPRTGLVEAAMPGGGSLRLWSLADDDIAAHVFWEGWAGHEPETAHEFYRRASSARVTLDIGAHVGYFSVLAGLANPSSRVFAFEALDAVYQRLTKNVSLNRLENVTCMQLAVGREVGRARFYHVPRGIPSSSSLSGNFMEKVVRDQPVVSTEVSVTTVDSFLDSRELSGVDLVKIDTEGTEDQVLEGMVRTLERDRPAIICEVVEADVGARAEHILAGFGYDFFLLTSEGPSTRAHMEPHPQFRNFLCLAEPSGTGGRA